MSLTGNMGLLSIPGSGSTGIQPTHPDYLSSYDPKTMSLSDYLMGKYDPTALNKFREEALRKGPSSWATLSKEQQAALASGQREKGAREVSAQTAQQEDDLAARGGLSSGARERASQEGAKNYLSMSQDLGKQEKLNDLQIGVNDESNRIQQLGMLPGLDMEQAKAFETAKSQDITNNLAENDRRNQYNQNWYNQQMQAWGAGKQADATAASGKHGFLGMGK